MPHSLSWTECRFFIRFTSTSVPRSTYCVVCFKAMCTAKLLCSLYHHDSSRKTRVYRELDTVAHMQQHCVLKQLWQLPHHFTWRHLVLSSPKYIVVLMPDLLFIHLLVWVSVLELPTTEIFSFSQICWNSLALKSVFWKKIFSFLKSWLGSSVHRHWYEQLELFSLRHTGGNIHLLLAGHNVNINSALHGWAVMLAHLASLFSTTRCMLPSAQWYEKKKKSSCPQQSLWFSLSNWATASTKGKCTLLLL